MNRRTGKNSRMFESDERFILLTNNPLILKTEMYKFIMDQDHDFWWKKRAKSIWIEIDYESSELRNSFPKMTKRQIASLTGGPFLFEKSRGYKCHHCKLYHERREDLQNRLNRSITTAASKTSTAYRIEKLNNLFIEKYLPGLGITSVFRFDINSYYKKNKKFKTYIAIRNIPNEFMFSFGCTCSTGTRVTPCVHGVLICHLFCL